MFHAHYSALVASYLTALGGWWLANRMWPSIWPAARSEAFQRPWRELGLALLGVLGIVGIGQLWSHGIRWPEDGALGPWLAAFNQILIFAPVLLVVSLRRQPWTTAWLPRPRIAARLVVGLALASLALTAYSLTRDGAHPAWTMIGRIVRFEHVDELAQVFLEDVTIAILFVRLAAAVGARWATVLVACLFAAGHVPALLAGGASASELAGLLRDAALGVAVILVLQRSRDVLWFCCVHFALDMTQFASVSGVG